MFRGRSHELVQFPGEILATAQSFVSLLRGINVGGKNIVKMEKLRSLCESLGLENPRTYLQSGNVVFESSLKSSELASVINGKMRESLGIDVPVIIRSRNELSKIVAKVPYPKKTLSDVYVTFLSEAPKYFPKELFDSFASNVERCQLDGTEVFLYLPQGYGRTKLNNNLFEKKLKLMATTRNWKTVVALLKMSDVP